jgi:hypothetical protein
MVDNISVTVTGGRMASAFLNLLGNMETGGSLDEEGANITKDLTFKAGRSGVKIA